jgi:clathrin heavy chain
MVTEIGTQKRFKTMAEVSMQNELDFPVVMQVMEKFGLIFLITNAGFLYIYEITKLALIFRCKISDDSCFVSAKNTSTGGLYVINKKGKLIGINVDTNNLLPFIMNVCKNIDNVGELCVKLASRYNLPGGEKLFSALFKNHLQNGNWQEAARVARDAPNDFLRNMDTINIFKNSPSQPGQQAPILIYYQTLMEKGKLNSVETLEIVKPLVLQQKKQVIEAWFNENKFTCSEELSEIVKTIDPQLSLKMLLSSGSPGAHSKVIEGLCQTGQVDKVFAYCNQNNYRPDYVALLRTIVMVNPEAACNLSSLICNRQTGSNLVDVNTIIEIFQSRKRIPELTKFLLEYLMENRPEDSFLQTKLLELNLFETPKAAEIILNKNLFSHYDKNRIAQLCEKCGSLQLALQNYSDINDIKRVVLNTHSINPIFLVEFFGRLSPENTLVCLQELMKHNQMQNLGIVVEASVKYNGLIPTSELIKLFETFGSFNGLFSFMSKILNTITDPELIFKYISSAVISQNWPEVERVIKEYENYDPVKVKEFFLDKKLVNPRPLVLLCDKYDYIEDLTKYLYKNKLTKFLENYLFQARPQNTPRVCATLLYEDCDENYIKQILNTVRGSCPIDSLVEEFLKINKLKLLQKFLEDREQEGNQTIALHNALAMIYVDINNNAKDFLLNNKFYDSKVVGKYCENSDPHLACIAYRRAMPACDDELIELTNKMALYRLQGQYLVESSSEELWRKVLDNDNPHKQAVIDQVISVILPVTRNAEEVKVAVRAFIEAGLQSDLMELLEKLVLHNSEFSRNKNLQNLLIITAMTADPKRVKGFLTKLDSYDAPEIAIKCLESDLPEEAYFIYDKTKDYSNAMDVIINNIKDIKRATIYAEKNNYPEVWSKLGRAKLEHDIVDEAIDAFIKSNDAEKYIDVIFAAQRQNKFEELIKYLHMARNFKKDKIIDGELVYSLSKCNKLSELEAFLVNVNSVELGVVADRLYEEKIWEPAKILYEHIQNNSRLASCLIFLKQYQQAIVAAKKSNSNKCWKEVCFACVRAKEFKLASQAGNNLISHPDHVEELIKEYEKWGAYSELILLFEANLSSERNHIITELGILYAKYQEEKLMDHCRNYYEKIIVPKLIRVCELHYHWPEVVFLYNHYSGHDSAIQVMMEHSPFAFKHDLFCQTLQKVSNTNIFYEAIRFYIDEQPQLLNEMLKFVGNKLDLSQAVLELRRKEFLQVALPFLKSVQATNNYDVNEALNEIYVDEEDADSLKASILEFASFDQLSLAKKIENHSLLEFRRISALVYRQNKKYQQSVEISKKLEFYKDAIETALESTTPQLCEDLIRFFAANGDKECFCACLYTCYEYIKPDIAMELAWRYDFTEFIMPFMIQTFKDLTSRIDYMQRKAEDKEKKEIMEQEEKVLQPLDIQGFMNPGLMGGIVPYGMEVPNVNMGGFQGQGMGGQGQGQMPGMNMNMNMNMGGFGGGY